MKQLFTFLAICLCLFWITIQAEHSEEPVVEKVIDDSELNIPFLDLSAAPSSIVGGAVNVITGSYFESECDLVIPGANSLILQRSYNSSSHEKGNLCHSWDLNLPSTVTIFDEDDSCRAQSNDRGACLTFKYFSGEDRDMKIGSKQLKYGATNCSGGILNSQTNLKRRILYHNKGGRHCELHVESGEILFYSKEDDQSKHRHKKFLATKNLIPTGCSFDYYYDDLERLIRVSSKGVQGNRLSHLNWEYPHKFKHEPTLKLKSSDGRSIVYNYKKQKSTSRHKRRYCLTSVIRDHAPNVSYRYEYEKDISEKLVEKSLPNDRYLKINYYKKGKNQFGSEIVKISDIEDSRWQRVLSLYAPVGTDESPIKIWSFKYNLDKKHSKTKLVAGTTDVVDALGHMKQYQFTDEQRLISVKHYFDDGRLYRNEKMIWGDSDSKWENTFLLARGVTDEKNVLLARKDYKYDENGNVLKETLRGNLTGGQEKHIKWNDYLKAEAFSKKFTYNKNLLLKSDDDGKKKTTYTYVPKTNLVRLKLISDKEKIRERSYFEYDENSVLIKEIVDDGSSLDICDLTDVTERRIKKIIPTSTQPIGLPKVIEESCLNLSTGREELISLQENVYSRYGNLLSQSIYDSKRQYRYSKKWTYDAYSNIIEEIDPLGQTTTYKYDQNNNRIFQQTPNLEYFTTFTYDYANRLISQKEIYNYGLELVTSYTYDYMGNRVEVTDIYGNTTKYRYDEFGRLTEKINPPIVDINGVLVSPIDRVVYDQMNNPIERIDSNGYSIKTRYTAWSKPYLVSYPDGSSESFIYDIDGTLLKSIGKNGSYALYEYDYQQRCTSKKIYSSSNELLSQTSATYNAFHVLTEVDESGSTTYYTYDCAGRKINVKKNDAETIYVYDLSGREIELHERYGDSPDDFIVKAKEYDHLNQIIEESVRDLSQKIYQKVTYEYDSMGNRNKVMTYNDAGINLQLTEYDAKNRPIKIIDALGNVTTIHNNYSFYNSYGQNVAFQEIVDALGNRNIVIFDAMGNVAVNMRKNSFGELTQKHEFTYDQNCNKKRLIDTVLTRGVEDRQVVTVWKYDSCGRVSTLTEALGTPEVRHTKYTYTNAGEKKEVIKANGTVLNHSYDGLGRLASLSSNDGSIHYAYTYDLLSNPVRIDDEIHQIATIKMYDANNQLISETLGNNLSIQYTYDRLGRATHIELPDGSSQETHYSATYISEMRRLTADGVTAYQHNYVRYDLSGNVVEAQLAGGAGITQIQYDLLGRPTHVQAPNWSESLDYDAVGNLIKRDIVDSQGPLECCYAHDDLYQLASETGPAKHEYQYDSLYNRTVKDDKPLELNALNQLLYDTETKYTYDRNGNLIRQAGPRSFSCTYDALDRLISVQSPDETIEYLYDSENRRLSKCGGSSGVNRFIYIGSCEIGNCNSDGKIVEYRLLGQGKGAEIGAAVALELEGVFYIPLHDAQGSVVTLLNNEGHSVGVHRYSAFGEEVSYGKATLNPWRFSSKRYDSETGFINFGRRYFSPSTGRWITPDPIGYDDGPNLYCYVLNSPLTNCDLYGLYGQWRDETAIAGIPCPIDITAYRLFIQSLTLPKRDLQPLVYESSDFLNCSVNDKDPETFSVGTIERKDRGFGFTNGICTSRERAAECGQLFSDMSRGYKCDIVHNPSCGLDSDLRRYTISSRSYLATKAVKELHKNWDNYFDNSSSNSLYLQVAHSEGVNNVRNALISYNKERAQRIDVLAIAPSVYIYKGLCRSVIHLRSNWDFVPLVDSVGRLENLDSTRVLKAHKDAGWWDHDCTSLTYRNPVKDRINAHFN